MGKTASSNSRMFLIGTFLILAGNDDMHESLDEFDHGLPSYKKMKIRLHDACHMTKMAATPIYGKSPSKIFYSRTGRPISSKLSM